MKFELDKSQEDQLQRWQDAIKIVHHEYGIYEYKFIPNGIGYSIIVYSEIADEEIDLTDVTKW